MLKLSEQRAEIVRAADPLTPWPMALRPAVTEASTWLSLSGHWLQSAGAAELELEARQRRLAAVARWRGEGAARAATPAP